MNELVSDRTSAEAHSKEQQSNAVASSDQCLDKDREISHDGIFEEDLMENSKSEIFLFHLLDL